MMTDELVRLEERWRQLLKGVSRSSEEKIKYTSITAAELLEKLSRDEEYQKWLKEKEQVGMALKAAYREDATPLIEDLRNAGFNIESHWDLVNTNSSYEAAVPILLKHLPRPYHLKTKEGIVRALTVKEAVGRATPLLIAEYEQTPKEEENLRWLIGNAVSVTISRHDIDAVVSIVSEQSNGTSREMFVVALGKVTSDKAEDVLIKLLDDDEVVAHALEALGRMKSKKAREKISALTNDPRSLVKREAQKALKKLS